MARKDRESRRGYIRAYYKQNKERFKEHRAMYYIANKESQNVKNREYYKLNRSKIIAQVAAYRGNNQERYLFTSARKRAQKNNIAFNLELSDVIIPVNCPLLGLVLSQGKKFSQDASPTLDRINPHLGYVKGNVAVISRLANDLKGQATADQHRLIADWIDSFAAFSPPQQTRECRP